MEPTTKKVEKQKNYKLDMLRSIGKQSGWSAESQSWRRKGRLRREGFAETESLRPEWKSEGEMDDESGELMEPVEEVPFIRQGESE